MSLGGASNIPLRYQIIDQPAGLRDGLADCGVALRRGVTDALGSLLDDAASTHCSKGALILGL
jgi:hypothetical protein